MKLHIFTAIFLLIATIEFIYPLGDIIHALFGTFGDLCGWVYCLTGLTATVVSMERVSTYFRKN